MLSEYTQTGDVLKAALPRPFGSDLMEHIIVGTPATMGGKPTMCNTGKSQAHPQMDKDDTT